MSSDDGASAGNRNFSRQDRQERQVKRF